MMENYSSSAVMVSSRDEFDATVKAPSSSSSSSSSVAGVSSKQQQQQQQPPPPPKSSSSQEPQGGVGVLHRRSRRRSRRNNKNEGNAKTTVPSVDPAVMDKVLRESHLPAAYSFEIPKTVQRILQLDAQHVALQMPEGLLLYATVLADVLQRLCTAAAAAAASSAAITTPTPTTTAATAADPSGSTWAVGTEEDPDATTETTPITISNGKNVSHSSNNKSLKVSILGDVTYGACCIDDLGAQALGADLLVHYGHSCLVPLQHTVIPCLYVFVEIQIDIPHMVECLDTTLRGLQQQDQQQQQGHYEDKSRVSSNTDPSSSSTVQGSSAAADTITDTSVAAAATISMMMPHVYFLGTVQFRHALAPAMELLKQKGGGYSYKVSIPQVKPLSPGEVLGCTSPVLRDHISDNEWSVVPNPGVETNSLPAAVVCFVADGRFHLESTMIANASAGNITFYRYDPYSKRLSTESYDYPQMQRIRQEAIQRAKTLLRGGGGDTDSISSDFPSPVLTVGIILGTLGRQGNPAIVKRIRQALRENFNGKKQRVQVRTFVLLLSEITPSKLQMLQTKVRLWIQVACPRLSIDWGHCFSSSQQQTKQVILLSPYEFFCCLEQLHDNDDSNNEKDISSYHPPMDFYSHSGGPWSNYYQDNKDRQG